MLNGPHSNDLYRSSLNLNIDWMKDKLLGLRATLQEASQHLSSHGGGGGGSGSRQRACDPYVTLRLVPETRFSLAPKFKTKAQRRTLFPLFDEKFDL